MILDDPLGLEADGDICTVCVKRFGEHDALARINNDGETVSICSPLCMEAFQRDPDSFAARRLMRHENEKGGLSTDNSRVPARHNV